ncbi:glycine betaine/proline ABC transporter, periplasmic substrate-binding protein [Roseobacter sp. SK209-2-6]|uniref:ABC transporter substrate-binding protein n=1 Tax=Roseobacter sp. SK209-2-6 TaxID=388739 RepID=UPI0000F3D51F|nr:ABC transporter substrate-binding protein [Roseobacter sp. SK209-2-6]EBA15760.1 glycine betaine/proline ABC transporter, periplasmic substrate-binding protein [Roseobacter sp. SK209-2-6]
MLKSTFAAIGTAAVLATGASAAELGDVNKPIRLGLNNWTGHQVSTYVAGEILKAAGYQVEYVNVTNQDFWSSLAAGDIHANVEVWSTSQTAEVAESLASGATMDLGDLELYAQEGLVYPAHVEELCPGLPNWEALRDCASVFATSETGDQGRLIGYPADWSSPGADRVAGLGLPFTNTPAADENGLTEALRESVENNTAVLATFWQPHWAMLEYNLKFVQLPPAEPACFSDPSWGPNPNAVNDCGFESARVMKAGWGQLAETWPAAFEILFTFTLNIEDQQPMMGSVDVEGRPVEEVVKEWMSMNEFVWRPLLDDATS